jgi:hypothetical protein
VQCVLCVRLVEDSVVKPLSGCNRGTEARAAEKSKTNASLHTFHTFHQFDVWGCQEDASYLHNLDGLDGLDVQVSTHERRSFSAVHDRAQ